MKILSRLLSTIGFHLRFFGKHVKAEEKARQAISCDERNYSAWRLLGIGYADRAVGPPVNETLEHEAEVFYKRAYDLAPDNYYCVWSLSCYLGYLGRTAESNSILDQYSKVDERKAARIRKLIRIYETEGSTRPPPPPHESR